jgi:hypothetical protein
LWSAKAAESARVKSWEIIAENLKKRGLEPGLGLGRLIPRGEQSGLQTHIATTESVSLCTRMKG